ncbi:MAG: CPBP family intramembrane glutamic endopeptidase [Acidobacteriota bacterium]
MTISTTAYLVLLVAVVPSLALLGKRTLDRDLVIPRMPFYAESGMIQLVLFALAVLVARVNGIHLWASPDLSLRAIVLGLFVLLVSIASMRAAWSGAAEATRRRLAQIVPSTPPERIAWVLLAAAAGVGEETAYRGTLFAILFSMAGDWLLAALMAAVIFGAAHLVQGWKNSAFVALFGFVFQLLAAATGALYVGMVVHFLYDVVAGFWISRLLRPPEEPGLVHG